MNDINWLDPIQIPLANKFIREHGFRGRVRSDDQCMVMRNQMEGIIAMAVLRRVGDDQLLTAVSVAPAYQGQGLVKQLLSKLTEGLVTNTFTFSLNYLVQLYTQHGFQVVSVDSLPNDIKGRFEAYKQQGRQITPMLFTD